MRTGPGIAIAAIILITQSGYATPQQAGVRVADPVTVSSLDGRVGIVMTPLPKADTLLRGAHCLLCLAAAAVANASLTSYAQTLPRDELASLKNQAAQVFQRKGRDVILITEDINLDELPDSKQNSINAAQKDHLGLKQKYNVDKLMVINITSVGFLRTYSGYIPTTAPRAMLQGAAYIVNLTNNNYEWFERIDIMKSAEGQWDEPPRFPGLTNAYFHALELGKDGILQPLDQVLTQQPLPQ